MSKLMHAIVRKEEIMKDIVVIKCGGSILENLSPSFFTSLRELKKTYAVVIVHGGGPEIDEMLTRLNIPVHKKNGLRITTKEVLEVVQMILCGSVNKKLVSRLEKAQIPAVGLAGCDGSLLQANALDKELGYVGEVSSVNTSLIYNLLCQDYVPVISPIGIDQSAQLYNINGDTAAAAVAHYLHAKHFLLATDVPGVLHNGKLIKEADKELIVQLIDEGAITGGMIPKVKAALTSLQGELESVMIVDGLHGFIKENGIIEGTTVMKGVSV